MTTCAQLITETVKMMHGFGQTNDRQAVLSNAIGPSDSTFQVDAASGVAMGINPGFVEIDSEQLYVTAVDPLSNTCTVANGFGRGYDGTTPTAHAQYSRIVSQPKFPRNWTFNQMNEVISGLFPDLFAVFTYTTTVTYPQNTYTLPNRPLRILDVQWQDPTSGDWNHTPSFSIDQFDGTLRLGSGPLIGRPMRIIYATEPVAFTSESDDFSVTGLPASTADLLTLGVVAKYGPTFDVSRAQLNSIEQSSRSQTVPPNTGLNLGTYYQKQFDSRLKNEATSLRRRYPATMRRVV